VARGRQSLYGEVKQAYALSLTPTARKWLGEFLLNKYGGTSVSDSIERAARGYVREEPTTPDW